MYKVFYNQKSLHFTTVLSNNSKTTPLFFIKYASANSIIKALKDRVVTEVYLYHSNVKKIEKHFFKTFPSVEAAGGLVKHQDGRYLFIYRNNKWDLPKGGVEKKEMIIEAAQREVTEETGVSDLTVEKKLSETFHLFKKGKRYRLKKTYWFKMKTNYMGELKPQTEEGIENAKWISKDKISYILNDAFENIRLIVMEVLDSDSFWDK